MPAVTPVVKASRGRPREFDIDQALAKAMDIFWQKGYHATSIDDLTKAMQITRGSLYKAFNDKKSVFIAAFERYVSGGAVGKFEQKLALGSSSLDLIIKLMEHYARVSSAESGTKGCLVTATAMEMLPHDPEISELVNSALQRIRRFLTKAIAQAKSDGLLDSALDEEAAALFVLSVIQGMRVLGKTERTEQELKRIVAFTLSGITATGTQRLLESQ